MLSQYICVREVGSTFFSTEIITLLSVIMILIGPSIAYFVADRVGDRLLVAWGGLSFVALLAVPVSIRYLAAVMKEQGFELMAMIFLLAFGSLFFSAFFAVFLPRLAKSEADFKVLYALELLGSLVALCSLVFIPTWRDLITLFWLLIVLSFYLALGEKRKFEVRSLSIFLLLLVGLGSHYYPILEDVSARRYYSVFWDKVKPQILETHYSPYQRVDVVADAGGKSLYLDGVAYYEAGDLHWFNYYIADLPGRLVKRKQGEKSSALIVGSGTLSSTGYLCRQGFDVTTVDIDAVVARMGMKYFSSNTGLKNGDFELVIDDARRFVRSVPDGKYDLIVLDIPAPFHVQTALLYVPSFFKELKRCLKPGGIVALNTCSYKLDDRISASITAGALSVFEDVSSIQGDSLGLTILYCSDHLPFAMEQLRKEAAMNERDKFLVRDDRNLRYTTRDAKPHTEENLCALMLLSRYEFPEIGN